MIHTYANFTHPVLDYCNTLDSDIDSPVLWFWVTFVIYIPLGKTVNAININDFFNLYNTQSRHRDETDIRDLIYMSRSKVSMAAATKQKNF